LFAADRTLTEISSQITFQHPQRHHELTSDLDCLQALFSTAGDYDCHRLQLDQPVNRTCSWILEHPNFASFRRTEDPTLLWVTGNPGCGKSILARFLADHLEFETGTEENMTLAPIICWFFFKDGQDNRTQSQSAVSALLHQLFTAWPILTKFGQAAYATKGSAFTNSPEAVWKVLCRACSSIPRREVICIVDALDECSEESRNRLIRMMMSTFSAPDAKKTVGCLKVLVTSRPLLEIEAQFESDNINRLRVEDETLTVAQDVARVIEHRLHGLKSKRILTPETCEVVERMLKEKADGTFLWISLVLESIVYLPSRKLKTVKQTLNAIPKDLDHLYARAIPELDEANRRISRRLLSILLVATRPLSLDEINICLSLDLDTEELADLEEEPDINHTVKTLGGLFIRIAQSQVSFVHQTAREYLLRDSSSTSPRKSMQHSIDSLGANLTLAQSCLRYLLLQDWVTYLELASDCEPNMYATRLLGDLPEAQSSFYRYAAANWPIHIGAGGPNYLPEPELRKEMDALCDQSSKPFAIWWSCYTGFNLYNAYSSGSYFHYVAAEGDWVVLKELLTGRSSDVDAYDEAGRTPLLEAAMNGHEAVAKLLIDKGAAVDSIDDDGCVPLLHAAENGHEAMAKLLLDKSADINAASKDGRTPLLAAAANGHEVVVTLLLRNNAAVDAADEYHRTPLLVAAENGHEAVVELLLGKGADMNAADGDGWTPLLQATKNGHEQVVKRLLAKAAPVNAGNKYGWTPLLEAARKGHEGVAKLLLDNDAGLEAMDGYGWTPLWWATNDSRVAVAKLLLEKGADVDAKADSSSQTPLVWAVEHDQKAIVKLLLEHGAYVPQTLLVGSQGRDVYA
jgi:ankyrin repeat protein